jgi:protein KTI12
MPLVILTGWPGAGKTAFAHALRERFGGDFESIAVVNDESLGIDKVADYADPTSEKRSRAAFLAAVERQVTQTTLVIADGCNEIKGFRYQLYCVARAACTPHVCIHVLSCASDSPVTNDVAGRYEEPNGQSRWDSPLFHVSPSRRFSDWEAVGEIIKGTPTKQPSLATRRAELPSDYVQQLEAATRAVIDQVQSNASMGRLGFSFKGAKVNLTCKPTGPELQRLKRQFILMNRQTNAPVADIERLFIDYLNKQQQP